MNWTLKSQEDADEFYFEISSGVMENSLGMINRGSNYLEIGDVVIEQSQSLLYQHSTGAIVWSVTPLFAMWIKNCPLTEFVRNRVVVELGSGTGALATLISSFVSQFVVTDQKPLLKLCERNCKALKNVLIREFDWELHEFDKSDVQNEEGVVIACDTIYNDYLQKPFMEAILTVWNTCTKINRAIVAVQLRDSLVIEQALKLFLTKFESIECYKIAEGFMVFYLEKSHLIKTENSR